MDFFSGDNLRAGLISLGAVEVIPPLPATPIYGLFSTEHVSIPLVGESISANGPTLLVVAEDSQAKGTTLVINNTNYSVYDIYPLDDAALVLLELHNAN